MQEGSFARTESQTRECGVCRVWAGCGFFVGW